MRNPVVLRDVKPKQKEINDNFLNEAQRKELKKMLTEKYTKLYGLANPGLVAEEIERFFAATAQVNQKRLVELETNIKRLMIKHKSGEACKQKAEVVKTPPVVQVIDEAAGDENRVPEKQMPTVMRNNPEFEGLQEDEWDNIGVYQAYILKQEKELERKRKQLEQKAIRSQLDHQVKEKERMANDTKEEHQSYVGMEQAQHERYLKNQQLAAEQREKQKKNIFDMQTKMIKARDQQLEKEKRLQDEIDKKIMDSVAADLAKQREVQALRAEAKRQEMERVRRENEVRRQKKQEMEAKERQEEIELQKLANELAQDLENQRAAEIKLKSDKIQMLMVVGDHAIKDQRAKTLEEERKLMEYMEKKNRLIEAKEKRIREKEKENKSKYREILDLQIQERDEKLKAERDYIREQAQLWKQETDYYTQFNETKAQTQKAGLEEHKKLLDQQAKEKDEKRKKAKSPPLPDEEQVKALMLEQIRNLEIQNEILNEQLKE